LPIALGAYTGIREGDALKLHWSAAKGGVITWRQSKTGDMVTVPIHRDLAAIIEAAKRKHVTMVVGQKGNPYTESGFRAVFFRFIAKLVKEKKVGEGLTFDGLRHTVGTMPAEAGADEFTIMSMLGHKSPDMARIYARDASRTRRAQVAIEILERGTETD